MGRKFKKLVSHKKKLSIDPEEKAFFKKYMNCIRVLYKCEKPGGGTPGFLGELLANKEKNFRTN